MCQCATQVETRSAGSISKDWPMPYQLKICPLRGIKGIKDPASKGASVRSSLCMVIQKTRVSRHPEGNAVLEADRKINTEKPLWICTDWKTTVFTLLLIIP